MTKRNQQIPSPRRPEIAGPADFQIVEAEGSADFRLIEAADDGAGDAPQLRRFSMTAYTGGKLFLPAFPFPVVADLAGMKLSTKSRPILRDHDIGQIVGHTETVEINAGSIRLSGLLSGSNEHAREVAESSRNGFPWQASIGATAQRMVFVDQGESVEVNGRRFTGPLYVARQSTLREISFVALGADDQTTARLAAAAAAEAHISTENLMEFAAWLTARGFAEDQLTENQAKFLKALYEEDTKEKPLGGDGAVALAGTTAIRAATAAPSNDTCRIAQNLCR